MSAPSGRGAGILRWALGVALCLGLLWVGGSLIALSRQVQAISERVAALEARPAREIAPRAPRSPGGGAATGERTPEPDVDAREAELEHAVAREVARRERERTDAQIAQWIEKGSAVAQQHVDALVDEGALPPGVAQDVVDLLVDEMYDTMELKRDVREGLRTNDEAMEEYRLIQEDYAALLAERIGEDLAARVRVRVSGK